MCGDKKETALVSQKYQTIMTKQIINTSVGLTKQTRIYGSRRMLTKERCDFCAVAPGQLTL